MMAVMIFYATPLAIIFYILCSFIYQHFIVTLVVIYIIIPLVAVQSSLLHLYLLDLHLRLWPYWPLIPLPHSNPLFLPRDSASTPRGCVHHTSGCPSLGCRSFA